MALVVAGERSGVGKTTVTLALLAALRRRGAPVQSFKVGPDYIDPMFHRYLTGRPCRNLDPILTSEPYVQRCFAAQGGVAYGVVEGVMGLFDGGAIASDEGSTAHVARLLDLPVLLVLDAGRLSRSVAAIAHGYQSLDPRLKLAGVVLNRVGSDRHLAFLKSALEPLGLPVLGVLHRQDAIRLPDRHLGLVPTDELPALDEVVDRLAHLGETCFDWSRLLPLLALASPSVSLFADLEPVTPPVRLAVARDRAFSFYYADNLDLLTHLGAELLPWSPLADRALPPGTQGLYLGGGFPEMFAAELEDNGAARQAVAQAIQAGMPVYAECGGLMYLCQSVVDFEGRAWEMVGALPSHARMGDRLTLGYRRGTAQHASPLVTPGETVVGHEFHRSSLSLSPAEPLYALTRYDDPAPLPPEGWRSPTLHASYTHLHWGATPHLAARFLAQCARYCP